MKKIFSFTMAIVLMLLCLTSCMSKRNNIVESSESDASFSNSDNNSDLSNEEQQVDVDSEPRLSDNYTILGRGSNINGDFYELVGQQEETSTSVTIKVGVIKNNKWLRELSTDNPFVKYITDINKAAFLFIGNSSFGNIDLVYRDIDCIYNAETQKWYYFDEEEGRYYLECLPYCLIEYRMTQKASSQSDYNNVIIRHEGVVYVLDTTTMTKKTVATKEKNLKPKGLFSEGLFYGFVHSSPRSEEGFHSIETGELVVDLSKYSEVMSENIESTGFVNGKATLIVKNQNDTKFKIVIDKTGEVLSEEKVS